MALDHEVLTATQGRKKLQFTIGTHHPECGDDEVFVDTVNEEGYDTLIGWSTKRRGRRPQFADGTDASKAHPDMFPVFAKKKEVNKAFTTRRF